VFPSSIKLTGPGSCTVESPSGISSSAGCAVDSSNTVTLINPFGSSSGAAAGAALSFIFSTGGTNPSRACDAGSFEVSTFATIGGVDYPIDYRKFSSSDPTSVFTPYIPTAATLSAKSPTVKPSDQASYKPATYSFVISP
jgi:hypothetical protein